MASAFTFFGGLADIFLSVMLWLIFESEKSPSVVLDGNRVYTVESVIAGRLSLNTDNCVDEDGHEQEVTDQSKLSDISFVSVSRKMID